jgi:signal transduction histidine kinase
MAEQLRVLIVEDSPGDAALLHRALRQAGVSFEAHRVQTRETFLAHLTNNPPDLILSDYAMPSFDGLTALELLRRKSSEIPFIFVSGCIGEERAIQALKFGATDYVLKDRLEKLVPAVQRAIREVRERADRRALEARLQQAGKLEAIGRFASGIAHDFNNLLTVVRGNGELALEGLRKDDPLNEPLRNILETTARGAELARQLLAFGRSQPRSPQALDLKEVVVGVTRMLRRIIGPEIDLGTTLPETRCVLADRGQLEQILMNLAVNAGDAMPQGGRLSIEIADVHVDAALPVEESASRPHVLLAVSDTGVGMSAEIRERVFEPYFTTKEQGTGLGLAIVYGIVTQSGGFVTVESEPGRGSTFKVYLPAHAEQDRP